MEIVTKSSPHLRRPQARVTRMMRDVSIALLPLVIFAIVQHGLAALWILLAAVASMAATEYVYYQVMDLLERLREAKSETEKQIRDLRAEKKELKAEARKKKTEEAQEAYETFLSTYKEKLAPLQEKRKEENKQAPTAENKSFRLWNRSFTLTNFSVVTSGVIYGLTLPDRIPLAVVIIGGVVGLLLAKLIFGGMGQNIFNPAAFARVFVVLSFGTLLSYETFVADGAAGATAMSILNENIFDSSVTDHYGIWSLFSGIGLPGSLGETSALLILVGGLYLALRRSFDLVVPLTYIGTVLLLSLTVMFTQGLESWFPLVHLFGGGLLFGAVFMATDPITSPVTRPGRIYFAFGLGVVTFLIRIFGNLPEGVVFAILIMNMFVPALDYPKWARNRFSARAAVIFGMVVVAAIIITNVGVHYVG